VAVHANYREHCRFLIYGEWPGWIGRCRFLEEGMMERRTVPTDVSELRMCGSQSGPSLPERA
jgi:hypothetical protein